MRLKRLLQIDGGRHPIIKNNRHYEPCIWIGDDARFYLRQPQGRFYRTSIREMAQLSGMSVGHMARAVHVAVTQDIKAYKEPARIEERGGILNKLLKVLNMMVAVYHKMRHKIWT